MSTEDYPYRTPGKAIEGAKAIRINAKSDEALEYLRAINRAIDADALAGYSRADVVALADGVASIRDEASKRESQGVRKNTAVITMLVAVLANVLGQKTAATLLAGTGVMLVIFYRVYDLFLSGAFVAVEKSAADVLARLREILKTRTNELPMGRDVGSLDITERQPETVSVEREKS